MASPGKFLMRLALVVVCAAMTAACTTSGRGFHSSNLAQIVPGQTTLAEANAILGADPVDIYRQLDGALTARWAYKASMVTDALYFRQELWLRFGSDGRFEQVVEKNNVLANPGQAPEPAPILRVQSEPALQEPVENPLLDLSKQGIAVPAVTYPLSL
jgi:hypothetical protein